MMRVWAAGLMAGFMATPAAAVTVYSNGFGTDAAGFTGANTLLTAPSGQVFLGPLSGGGTATLSLSGLPAHTGVTVSFDLYVLNSVDGNGAHCCGPDPFRVLVGGTEVFNETFAQNAGWQQSFGGPGVPGGTGAAATATLGFSTVWGNDWTYALGLTTPHSGSTLTIAFIGDANQGWSDEGYGIDNLVVELTGGGGPSGVPAPAAFALFGLGLIGLAAARR
jgi:hypothetical protein